MNTINAHATATDAITIEMPKTGDFFENEVEACKILTPDEARELAIAIFDILHNTFEQPPSCPEEDGEGLPFSQEDADAEAGEYEYKQEKGL